MKRTLLFICRKANTRYPQLFAEHGFRIHTAATSRSARKSLAKRRVGAIVVALPSGPALVEAELDQHLLATAAPLVIVGDSDPANFPAATGVFRPETADRKLIAFVRRMAALDPSIREALVEFALTDAFRAPLDAPARRYR